MKYITMKFRPSQLPGTKEKKRISMKSMCKYVSE